MNSIDQLLREILMKREIFLAPKGSKEFLEEIKKLWAEKRYWENVEVSLRVDSSCSVESMD